MSRLGVSVCSMTLLILLPRTSGGFDFTDVRTGLVNVYNQTVALRFLPMDWSPKKFAVVVGEREVVLKKIRADFIEANRNALEYQNRVVNTLPTTNLNGLFELGVKVSILGQIRESVEIQIRLFETDLMNSRNLAFLESYRDSQKQTILLATKLKEISAEILKIDSSNIAVQKNILSLGQLNSQISHDIFQAAKTSNELEVGILRMNVAINETSTKIERINKQSLSTQRDMLKELIGGSWISIWGLVIAFVSLLLTAVTSVWSLCLQLTERSTQQRSKKFKKGDRAHAGKRLTSA